MKLLHIAATPRGVRSNTLRISDAFLAYLQDEHADLEISTLDLFAADLPAVAGRNIESKYAIMKGLPIGPQDAESWSSIERLIAQFLAADVYLVSTPMWNFNIPYVLKYYIDAIVQPGYLFRYNEQGVPEGMCRDKRMICVTTRGGDYSAGSLLQPYDVQETYLRAIFGFVGIDDIQFIHAQLMDVNPDLREAAIHAGIEDARVMAAKLVGGYSKSS
jgi:FMN-dependent NADH-azoreductase